MASQYRLRDLMLGLLLLSVVFALARVALVLQVENGQPTAASIAIQIAAGGLLALTLSAFLIRVLRADSRNARSRIYACCFIVSIPGLALVVSLISMNLQ